jgi:hypothetical protein
MSLRLPTCALALACALVWVSPDQIVGAGAVSVAGNIPAETDTPFMRMVQLNAHTEARSDGEPPPGGKPAEKDGNQGTGTDIKGGKDGDTPVEEGDPPPPTEEEKKDDAATEAKATSAGGSPNNPASVQGSIRLNGDIFDVDCDCTDEWKEKIVDNFNKGDPDCASPTKFKIQRIDVHATLQTAGLSPADVREFLGLPSALTYVDVKQYPLADMDGRTPGDTLSTPGGDFGEFVQALDVYADMLHGNLTSTDVMSLFGEWLEQTAPRKFYLHSSVDAVESLKQQTQSENLDIEKVAGGPMMEELLGKCPQGLPGPCGLLDPLNVGIDHVKLMLKHPGKYLVKPDVLEKALRAVYQTLWDASRPGHGQINFDVLQQARYHQERAVVAVQVSDECAELGQFPLVAQAPRLVNGREASVYALHPGAASARRKELAKFFADSDPTGHVEAWQMEGKLESKALRTFEQTLRHVAKRLPVYRVWVL